MPIQPKQPTAKGRGTSASTASRRTVRRGLPMRSGVFAGHSEVTGSRRHDILWSAADLLPLQVSRFLRQIFEAVTSHHVGVIQSDGSQPVAF